MTRLKELSVEELNTEQRSVYDSIQTGPRGNIGMVGPFGVWIRSPKIGQTTQALGSAIRYGTTLADDVREVAICTVGAHYHAKFEFAVHSDIAREAGVEDKVLEAIQNQGNPSITNTAQNSAYRVALALLSKHRIDTATYVEARSELTENGLIELVGLIGYYCMVCLTLNTFEIGLAEGTVDPFPEFS